MTERTRDLTLLIVIAGLLLVGIAFDVATEDAEPLVAESSASTFYERAQFCPARVLSEGAGAELAVATASNEAVPVGLEPLESEPLELIAGDTVTRPVEVDEPVAAEGYGAPVASTTSHFVDTTITRTGEVEGAGAGNCALNAGTNWYFPAGDSSVSTDYRVVVANPFPDEAVVRINFLTPEGSEPSAKLSQVAVPSGEVEVVSISGSALPQDQLSVALESVRGRVIAWKALWTKPDEGPEGFEFTLGATSPRTDWYFPVGEVSEGATQAITLMNPNPEESQVSVTLTTSEEPVQSSKLIEIAVPGETSKELVIPDRLDNKDANLGGVSAVVSVDNEVPVVAESTTTFDTDELSGRVTELGSPRLSDRWLAGPPASRPDSDSLIIHNPSTEDATVDVTIYDGEGDSTRIAPDKLQNLVVPGGLRTSVSLDEHTQGAPLFVAVTSEGNRIVVERLASERGRSDLSSVMGQPEFGRAPIER